MKVIELRVGDKASKREAVKVPLNVPENLSDLTTLAKGSEAVVVRWATRGQRIEAQERSGAREAFKEGKTAEEIAAIVNSYDPTVQQPRGGGGARKPKTIALPKGKKNFSAADLKALLEANGIKVAEEGDVAQPA